MGKRFMMATRIWLPKIMSGMLRGKAYAENEVVAVGDGGDGQGVVEAHDDVGDNDGFYGRPHRVGGVDVFAVVVFDKEFGGDPDEQQAAEELEVGDLKQYNRYDGEE
jgi:hypothetical protein